MPVLADLNKPLKACCACFEQQRLLLFLERGTVTGAQALGRQANDVGKKDTAQVL
jgi:hypothetical protein